jgi:hypothetical protein
MKIIRVKNPKGASLLKGKLLQNGDYTDDQFVEKLGILLHDYSDEVFVLQAWEGEEIVGFLIAYDMVGAKHVFVHQVWSDAKYEGLSDKLFFRLLMWTQSLGKNQIRGETKRDSDVISKRWNFKEISKIVAFDIPENLEEQLIQGNHSLLVGDKEDG